MGLAQQLQQEVAPEQGGRGQVGWASTLSNFDLVKKHSQANRDEISLCLVRVVVRGGGEDVWDTSNCSEFRVFCAF